LKLVENDFAFPAFWFCIVLLLGSGMAADIPCGYNETGFHEIAAPDISTEQIQTVTLSAPSQDQGSPLAGVPRLSDPGKEVKSNIDLINDAVDP